jgi:FdhD protein
LRRRYFEPVRGAAYNHWVNSAPKLLLSNAARPATFNVQASNEHGEAEEIAIAGEHPLTLYVDRREILTIMTLGAAPEALIIGYLLNQRLIESVAELASVQVDWDTNACAVTTRNGLRGLDEKMTKRTKTTGCGEGTVFGDLMAEIDSVNLRNDVRITQATLYALQEGVRHHDTIYKQSGAVHGCALFSPNANAAELLYFVEDVGRHNAVDAIAGMMALNGVSGDDKIFYTTGRLTSEMVIKCAQMRIPFLVSRSGLTQMGHAIAKRVNMTMIGRAVNKRYLVFSGADRIVSE